MSDRYVVVFTGLPGTGTSTLADRLATDAGVPAFASSPRGRDRSRRRARRPGRPAGLPTFVEMAEEHVGPAARSMLHTYWNCGDPAELTGWFRSAGLHVTGTTTHLASARFASVPEFVGTEIESTPMMGLIDEATLTRIVTGAHDVLRPFTAADGSVDLGLRGHIVTAARTQ